MYANVFAQLTAIVDGDPPELPEHFSDIAKDFVSRCLHKIPERRATYAELLVSLRNSHPPKVDEGERLMRCDPSGTPFPRGRRKRDVDMPGWVAKAIEARDARVRGQQQQLQAAHNAST